MYQGFTDLHNNLALLSVILFVLGIVIGSFLNVVIYRMPIMLQHKWHNDCVQLLSDECALPETKSPVNLVYPASHCPKCSVKIPAWANVPLIGYFILGGRCFNCKIKISRRYPLIELITGVLFVAAGYLTNDSFILLGFLIFLSFVICLIFIDYDTFFLPDELTLVLMWLGILFNLHGLIAPSLESSVIGAALGYMLLWSIFWLFKLITKKEGMGYGDFKFLAAILAWVGYQGLIPITLAASVLGIIYFVGLRIAMLFKSNLSAPGLLNYQIPFGPFLGSASIIFIFTNKYFILW